MSDISFGFQDEDKPFRPAREAAPDETDIDLRPRQNPAGQGAARRLLCDAQHPLCRLHAFVDAASELVRAGIVARMAYREASGERAHAWADPLDLALRDLGLTGSYAIATWTGRSRFTLPYTAGRQALEPWENKQDGEAMGIDQTVASALDVVRSLPIDGSPPTSPIAPPDGLVLPKTVFPPFWAAYPTPWAMAR